MSPEAGNFNSEKQTLIGSLPKLLERYPLGVQKFIEVAGRQDTTLLMQKALVTYAVYVYGPRIVKSDHQRAISQLSIEDISQILCISKEHVKKHITLIRTEEGIVQWDIFEQDIHRPIKKPREQRKQKIDELKKQGLDNNEIAERLEISLPTVKKYVKQIDDQQGCAKSKS